jgi:hypothetical protein
MAHRTSSRGSLTATSRIGRGADGHALVSLGNSRHNRCFRSVSAIRARQSIACDRPRYARTRRRKSAALNIPSQLRVFVAGSEPAMRYAQRYQVATWARAESRDHRGLGEEGGRQWT